MADDPLIFHKPFDIILRELRDLLKIKASKGSAEVFTFAKDGDPGQTGLETFKADLLKQTDIVGNRMAPLVVVIGLIERVSTMPPAAVLAVFSTDQPSAIGFELWSIALPFLSIFFAHQYHHKQVFVCSRNAPKCLCYVLI